jgi:hypothetical protein
LSRRRRALEPREDPAVLELEVAGDLGEGLHRLVPEAHEREAARVPDLVGEVAAVGERGLDVLVVEVDVGPDGALAHDRVAHGVRTVRAHDLERVDAVAERLRHLAPLGRRAPSRAGRPP